MASFIIEIQPSVICGLAKGWHLLKWRLTIWHCACSAAKCVSGLEIYSAKVTPVKHSLHRPASPSVRSFCLSDDKSPRALSKKISPIVSAQCCVGSFDGNLHRLISPNLAILQSAIFSRVRVVASCGVVASVLWSGRTTVSITAWNFESRSAFWNKHSSELHFPLPSPPRCHGRLPRQPGRPAWPVSGSLRRV